MRAGEVIRGLRALAGKSRPQLTRLDLDDVIKEVLALTKAAVEEGIVPGGGVALLRAKAAIGGETYSTLAT